jgi:2-polyprenyl-3-methyl-5-hydroxy-6-metoxy-1,4-benzoquinol methylase
MADTISPFVGTHVLEIGAGMGNLTRRLCRHRKRYIATDLNAEYVEQLRMAFRHRPLVEVARLDAENAEDFRPFEQSVDTVLCLHILEHLTDDAEALRRIRTLLQPAGRLILLVPNDPSAFGTLDTALGQLRRYDRAPLTQLVEQAGYEVEKVIEFNRVSTPGWRFFGKVLQRKTVSNGSLKCFDRLVWLWRRIDSALPWKPTSLIVIARRRD